MVAAIIAAIIAALLVAIAIFVGVRLYNNYASTHAKSHHRSVNTVSSMGVASCEQCRPCRSHDRKWAARQKCGR